MSERKWGRALADSREGGGDESVAQTCSQWLDEKPDSSYACVASVWISLRQGHEIDEALLEKAENELPDMVARLRLVAAMRKGNRPAAAAALEQVIMHDRPRKIWGDCMRWLVGAAESPFKRLFGSKGIVAGVVVGQDGTTSAMTHRGSRLGADHLAVGTLNIWHAAQTWSHQVGVAPPNMVRVIGLDGTYIAASDEDQQFAVAVLYEAERPAGFTTQRTVDAVQIEAQDRLSSV